MLFEFLTRPGCHLCAEAQGPLHVWAERVGAAVETINVEDRVELEEEFGVRIPVIRVEGRVLLEGPMSYREIGRAVRRAAR